MPRFVILEHDHPVVHWDLMLEAGAVLHTWRLAAPPDASAGAIAATALADHRLMYLDYEGPISGQRGAVTRWDTGAYAEELESLPEARCYSFEGNRVRGRVRLDHAAGSDWLFQYELTAEPPSARPQ